DPRRSLSGVHGRATACRPIGRGLETAWSSLLKAELLAFACSRLRTRIVGSPVRECHHCGATRDLPQLALDVRFSGQKREHHATAFVRGAWHCAVEEAADPRLETPEDAL